MGDGDCGRATATSRTRRDSHQTNANFFNMCAPTPNAKAAAGLLPIRPSVRPPVVVVPRPPLTRPARSPAHAGRTDAFEAGQAPHRSTEYTDPPAA